MMKLFSPLHQSSSVIHNWTPRSWRTLAYRKKILDGKIFSGSLGNDLRWERYSKEPWSHKRKPWETLASMMIWRTWAIWEVKSSFRQKFCNCWKRSIRTSTKYSNNSSCLYFIFCLIRLCWKKGRQRLREHNFPFILLQNSKLTMNPNWRMNADISK